MIFFLWFVLQTNEAKTKGCENSWFPMLDLKLFIFLTTNQN
jgi:hypothetical protein